LPGKYDSQQTSLFGPYEQQLLISELTEAALNYDRTCPQMKPWRNHGQAPIRDLASNRLPGHLNEGIKYDCFEDRQLRETGHQVQYGEVEALRISYAHIEIIATVNVVLSVEFIDKPPPD
jgi:hypothetical protein